MPIYMKFPGIHGAGKGKFAGWIELASAQVGSIKRSGGGANSVPSDVSISKLQDQTTPHLFRKSLSGNPEKVTIAFVGKDSAPYLIVELEGAVIAGFHMSGNGGPTERFESMTLNFTKITYSSQGTSTPSNDDDVRASTGIRWIIDTP